jgi:trimethylamine--corrinoid protein Co-methyltransferase
MNMTGSVLSQEEIERLHGESLRILEEVGVRIQSEKTLGLIENKGAIVNWDTHIVKFPRSLVETALGLCPKEFVLGARNSNFDLSLPSGKSSINLDGMGTRVRDFHTGERREAKLSDIAYAARVFDAMEGGTVLWPPLAAQDVKSTASGFLGAATAFLNSRKHIQDEVKKIEEVSFVWELLKVILGSEEEIRNRKIYSATYCTVAPLSHDKEMLEATMELTRLHAPILMYPMPATGSTGPASLFSNIAVANAETLSSIVIFQMLSPGTPLIYGAALGTIDRRSGTFLEGAVETALQLTAMTQIGRHYKLPTIVAGCLTDSHSIGIQAIMEKTLTTLPLVLAGVDVVQGAGFLESSMTLCLEQILIDGEILHLCNRMAQGIDSSEEKILFDDIEAVGPGNHFLKQKSTRSLFRTDEFYTPPLSVRDSYDSWLTMGSPDMVGKARAKVEAILSSDLPSPLDYQKEKVIREIMREAEETL